MIPLWVEHTLRVTKANHWTSLIRMFLQKLILQGANNRKPWYYLPSGVRSSHVTIIWIKKYPTLWHIVICIVSYCVYVSKFGSRKSRFLTKSDTSFWDGFIVIAFNFRPSTSKRKLHHPKSSLLRKRHMQLLGCPTSQSHSWEEDGGPFANAALSRVA